MPHRLLISKLFDHFEEDPLVLSAPGIAPIITFKRKATKVLNIIADDEDDIMVKAWKYI